MRILCNENVPLSLISALEQNGHDVVWVRKIRPGISDAEVSLGDFGTTRLHHIRQGLRRTGGNGAASKGHMWSYSTSDSATHDHQRRRGARADWIGHFSEIEPGRVRLRLIIAS